MKKIKIQDIPTILPANHYNMTVRRITESPGPNKTAVAARFISVVASLMTSATNTPAIIKHIAAMAYRT